MYDIQDIRFDDIASLRIDAIMREKGVTIDELSTRTGLSKSVIKKCICGTTSVTYERLVSIAYGLRVELRDLFRETGWTDLLSDDTCVNDSSVYGESKTAIQCIMSVLECSVRVAEDVLMSIHPVTPSQYCSIAMELGDMAYLVVPHIVVKDGDGNLHNEEKV